MLNNLSSSGQRILILAILFVVSYDLEIYLSRCEFSPSISEWGVIVSLTLQVFGLFCITSTLEYFTFTAVAPKETPNKMLVVLSCMGILIISYHFLKDSVLYADTFGKPRGTISVGYKC